MPSPEVPDLRSLLREATRPSVSVTVILKQGVAAQIEALEAELEAVADTKPRRAGAASPAVETARKLAAAQDEMRASAVTFTFEPLTHKQRDQIRDAMGGRDDPDELDLRATAAMCVSATGPDGQAYPGSLEWSDFAMLRDVLGVHLYESTIDAAANRASGGSWSVPFSQHASLILGTLK